MLVSSAMTRLPRGIAPDLLLNQVKNTVPYLLAPEADRYPISRFPGTAFMKAYAEAPEKPLSHFEYFRLCLSAHYLTCATPVPTDVDNQIRVKLWPRELPLETALQMSDLILESRHWDFSQVSPRVLHGLCGHHGEWFTVATGAYCALGQYADPRAIDKRKELLDQIAQETLRHSDAFGALWRANQGLDALKVSAHIAHNFGDMDRVMDIWELHAGDPLRLHFYKLGSVPFDANRNLRYQGRLWVAGELYKSPIQGSSMAMENHRHFALRKPRCLRRSPRLWIHTGPFFDDWGRSVAETLQAGGSGDPGAADVGEVLEALQHGWQRLPGTLGYGRALRGMRERIPSLDIGRHKTFEVDQQRFEKLWSDEAVRLMDDIPSRA